MTAQPRNPVIRALLTRVLPPGFLLLTVLVLLSAGALRLLTWMLGDC